jgi:hydroxymethylbilane synthase
METLKLGTRGSQLALFQAYTVARLLEERAGAACEIHVIKTSGDHLAEAPLADVGGKRLFVKEIEDALLNGAVDLAVHSSKDMPAALPEGLTIGAVLPREDPRDAVVLPKGRATPTSVEDVVATLGREPRIGTSSVRRVAQLTRLFPGATFLPIRGNLDTRLRKLDAGEYDALVLAAAGLIRLEHRDRISVALPTEVCVPSPGQGAIAAEVRSGDPRTLEVVRRIDDEIARAVLTAERAVVARLGGGCQMPLGAYAVVEDGMMTLTTVVLSSDGARAARAESTGPVEDAERIGTDAADVLLLGGAGEILGDLEHEHADVEGLQP